MYTVHRIITTYIVHCALSIIKCTTYIIRYTVIVKYTLYTVLCVIYHFPYTLYTDYDIALIQSNASKPLVRFVYLEMQYKIINIHYNNVIRDRI